MIAVGTAQLTKEHTDKTLNRPYAVLAICMLTLKGHAACQYTDWVNPVLTSNAFLNTPATRTKSSRDNQAERYGKR